MGVLVGVFVGFLKVFVGFLGFFGGVLRISTGFLFFLAGVGWRKAECSSSRN